MLQTATREAATPRLQPTGGYQKRLNLPRRGGQPAHAIYWAPAIDVSIAKTYIGQGKEVPVMDAKPQSKVEKGKIPARFYPIAYLSIAAFVVAAIALLGGAFTGSQGSAKSVGAFSLFVALACAASAAEIAQKYDKQRG